MTEEAVAELAPEIGVAAACKAAGRSRASHYRRHRKSPAPERPAPVPHRERAQPRALSPAERERVIEVLHSARFADTSPAQVWATLLDEGIYLCSQRTMYRLLAERGESGERRAQATHPAHAKPELIAAGPPNQVWSWDITKLLGPKKWTYYYLYVILDVYSRYVVGWMLAECESGPLAEALIAETCAKQGIGRDQLTVHADRGSSMTSKPVAFLLADLGIAQSHSRPRVSSDNPYSESQFKTMKYRPDFPERFENLEAARAWCREFFAYYNNEHGIPGWACSPRRRCTTARPRPPTRRAPPSSMPSLPFTPSGSSAGRPRRPSRRGSTRRRASPRSGTVTQSRRLGSS